MSENVSAILKRAAEKGDFTRTRYVERDIPNSMSNITIMSYFGDMKSAFVLSSIFLKRYRQEMKGSKYFVLCSWPGMEGFFPYVNEYWTPNNQSLVQNLFKEADGFDNKSKAMENLSRNLNHFFEEVVDFSIINPYYNKGLTREFFDKFKHVKVFLPAVPSALVMGTDFVRDLNRRIGPKVFIYPSLYCYGIRNGRNYKGKTEYNFWVALANRLIMEGFVPIVYQNLMSHDISRSLADKCVYVTDSNMLNVTAAMRTADCVLDVFSDIYVYAIAARCPVVCSDERARYFEERGFELDDLCGRQVPKEHIFAFSTILESNDPNLWKVNFFDGVINKLTATIEKHGRDKWPSAVEVDEIVPYANVRNRKVRKFGAKFIKVERD
jgi:hypothetical protein